MTRTFLTLVVGLGPRLWPYYLHVDDFGIIGTVAWACELLAQRMRMELELIGFDVKFTPCKDAGRYVGLEMRSQPAQWVPAGDRLAALDAGLGVMLNRDWLRLGAFRTVLGQFVAIALLWRPALSIPRASYRFALQECVSSKLWPPVRLELWQMRGILPLLIADVGAPNCEIVLSQDAAGPNVEARPSGPFCMGYATPPIDPVESILS